MDLQDFESQMLYFDKEMSAEVESLIKSASLNYSKGRAEPYLLKAFTLDRDNLSVLVALYRFYYYQHRYQEALDIAHHAMAVVAPSISFPMAWKNIEFEHLASGVMVSFTMVRFYLLALKGAAYLNLRMNKVELGVSMLNKVIELDSKDRLGARALLQAVGPAMVVNQDASAASVF